MYLYPLLGEMDESAKIWLSRIQMHESSYITFTIHIHIQICQFCFDL
jgi:hypothetical protein